MAKAEAGDPLADEPSATTTPTAEQPEVASAETGDAQAEGETGDEAPELAGPPPHESVQPPPGYGDFKFPTPPLSEEQLTLHAAAGYEVVAVYSGPSKSDEHVGFLRIGTRLRAGEKIVNDDCPRGWHALEGGGYACASRGLMVDSKPPFMSYEPKPPRVDQPFPYDWAYVRQWNTPQWWQVPNGEQLAATRELRAIRESERTGEPLPSEQPAAGGGGGEGGEGGAAAGGEGGEALPSVDGDGGGEEGAATPPPADPPPADPPPADPPPEPEEEKEPVNIPFSPSIPWLEKGYFLSLGETIREGERSYWRTARGGVVEKANAHPYEPRDYHGAELPPGVTFPVGFVMVKGGTKLVTIGNDNKVQATGKVLDKRTFLDLGEEVEISGRTYFTVLPYPPPEPTPGAETDGAEPADEGPQLFVKADVMRTPDLQPIPKGLDPWDHWIDVDITKQMLVAYEGSRPVYVTLVSTGKRGSDEEPFDTPTGRFRIRSKQITSNMDGATATDGNYAIQDVPWVMYFQGSYALHGAFWHESFGYVRSHGCVNLGATDARWLFNWTTPYLPQYWHGVSSSDDNPGTTVVIRKSEGKPLSE